MESEGAALSTRMRDGESKKSTETISILVVDDDTACLAVVAAILKKFKYEVVTVKHANDALCTLRIKGGAFDLVVSDVHMPDMNGFELQQAIAQEFSNLPVILMSADPKEGVALKGLENGAAFFIYKPVCPDDVRDLWQFAAMKKQNRVTIREEEINNTGNETIISVSSSSMNEDRDSKKKSSINEGSDAKKGETGQAGSSQKKPKMIWTNSLHNRFLEAIRSIGLDRAVPKKILEVMNVPGLTRENVASHLQKYRIFLRRVSDASYKVQYSADHKRLSSSGNLFMPSSTAPGSSSSSVLSLNRFPYHKPGGQYFPAAAGLFGQSRLMLPSKGSQSLLGSPSTGLVNLNYSGRPSLNLSSSSFSTPLMGPTTMNTSTYNSSSIPSNTMAPSNYVGYSVSNLNNLTGTLGGYFRGNNSTTVEQSNAGGYTNIPQTFDNSFAVGNNNINGSGDQLSNAIGNYQLMAPLSLNQQSPHCGNMGNGGGLNREPAFSPMFDLFDLEPFAAPTPLGQGDFHTTLPNQTNILNQAQQNAGETFATSNFYDDMSRWDHNSVPSFDPAPTQAQQQYCSQNMVKPQDQLGANSSAQLSNTILLPPNERDDEEFLESLLAPYGEDQTLEGI